MNAQKKAEPPATSKTSLYRLTDDGTGDLLSMIGPKYLEREGFQAHPVEHDSVRGLLDT